MDLAFAIAILLTSVLSLVAILHVMKGTKSSKYRNFPPGPRPLPLIGNLHILNPKKPYLTLIELSKTYGPVFSVQMGSRKAVVLAGYEAVKDALVNHAEEFGDRARIPMFQQMDKGNGLILSNGENWKVMRRFTITTLRDFGMGKSTIEDKVNDECGYLIDHFESFKGQPLDNAIVMNASVANIIVAILLGHRYDYQDPTFLRLLNLINENLRLLGSPMVSLYNAFPFIGFLPGEHKTILKNVEEICSFTRTVFLESLGHLDDDHKRSFIDAFLVRQQKEKSNPDTYFHNNNLLTVVKNLFSAGMETTSTSLRWGLLLLMKYPEVQKKVQEEIERVLGSAQAQYDDRNKMPYTNAVIHEIQRFANILPISIPHETASDVTFKGYFIPKMLEIVLSQLDVGNPPQSARPQIRTAMAPGSLPALVSVLQFTVPLSTVSQDACLPVRLSTALEDV
ncbi:cytochrome P450 2K4-like isoform X2 [Ambystoma mexicanum]|uniref:cytochrome P450 2K4-like isoform X2 n=1 Tax=Ambystoma mexicanum TaxID=8296 RepID=UPI0037E81E1E